MAIIRAGKDEPVAKRIEESAMRAKGPPTDLSDCLEITGFATASYIRRSKRMRDILLELAMDSKTALQDSYTRAALIPVVGSGISTPFGLPNWRTLIERAAEHFSIAPPAVQRIAELLDRREYLEAVNVLLDEGVSEIALQKYVAESMSAAKAAAAARESNYDDLARLSKVRYITTNYDRYLNDIADAKTFLLERLEDININQFQLSPYDHTVIPIHGEISRPESIVLSEASYKRLYGSARFREEFQQLRSHYTFLFIGFSFDDKYVQEMFDRVLQRFEAQHFILFDKSAASGNKEKIEKLKEKYGIEALYYDSSAGGHTKAISGWMQEVFGLKDDDVDLSGLDKLPKENELAYKPGEEEIIEKGRALIDREKLTELYELYSSFYTAGDFETHSAKLQIEIVCGLLWYWGYLRRDDRSEELMEEAQKKPAIAAHMQKLAFMYGQYLWTSRQFEKGISMLQSYDGEKSRLSGLLLRLLKVYQRFLPERDVKSGLIPVYGPEERDEAAKASYREAYEELTAEYVNPETYNLREIAEYKDRDSEQIAYYWLGIAAGQLFHEHKDAVQYLLRAFELRPNLTTCEELAQNYYELGIAGTRYREDNKKYQLDMGALLKAKVRFQYIMNFSDETVVRSMYERSGYVFLRTLFILEDYISFYEHWNRGAQYIQENSDLLLLKAEADAEYEHAVSDDLLNKLDRKNRRYIEYCCTMHRAEFFTYYNPAEAARLRAAILQRAEMEPPMDDPRVIRIVLDAAFFLRDIPYYERMKEIYPERYFADMQELGFEDELYGRLEDAERKLRAQFAEHKDYDGTFRILRGFYIRHREREKYNALLDEVSANPPGERYKQAEFYVNRVVTEADVWQDTWNAMRLYDRYYDQIKENVFLQKQVEENLKVHAADFSDFEDRIAWDRQQLSKAPRYARYEVYRLILGLYLSNSKYREADEIVQEMKREGVPQLERLDKLTKVCLRKQSAGFYCGRDRGLRSDAAFLDNMVRKARSHERYTRYAFGAEGADMILPIRQLLCVFRESRQNELNGIGRIHLMYTGLISLQNAIWGEESPFLRMILQWVERADNIRLAAPSFRNICKYAPDEANVERRAEEIQIKLYHREHPEYIVL